MTDHPLTPVTSSASAAPPAPEPRLCPACDYDLQFNTSGICPECGLFVGHGPISRIPWVHRKYRGDRRAYLETLKLLLFKPRVLASQTARRVPLAAARRFHHESLLLATIFASGILTVAFLLHSPSADSWLLPNFRALLSGVPKLFPAAPAFVLSDSLLAVIPLIPTTFLCLHASSWLYRCFFSVGKWRGQTPAAARGRRRSAVLAYYVSGLAPLLSLWLGATLICLSTRADASTYSLWIWRFVIPAGLVVFPLLTLWTFYFPTLTLLYRAGRPSTLRTMLTVALYPLIQLPLWYAIAMAVFWVVGYLLIAVASIAH